MRDFFAKKPMHVLALLAAAGLAARWIQTAMTAADAMHPDFGSFLQAAEVMRAPFDTGVREPGFVWWLWILKTCGAASNAAFRGATALWFLPALAGLHVLARRFLPPWGAWAAVAFYAFLPAQVQADTLGLRHVLEAAGVVWLLAALTQEQARSPWLALATAAAAAALLVACRVTHLATVGLLLAFALLRTRRAWPLAALLPALLIAGLHMRHNAAAFGNPTESVDRHTYWFANLEYIGRPGFPASMEEWQKDSYKKSLTFRQWAFQSHTPGEFVQETFLGYFRCLHIFFQKVYFSPGGRLQPLAWIPVGLYLFGLGLAFLRPSHRPLAAALSVFLLPYAFVSHVFWAGRFFVPVSPFVLILMVYGTCDLAARAQGVRTPRSGQGNEAS